METDPIPEMCSVRKCRRCKIINQELKSGDTKTSSSLESPHSKRASSQFLLKYLLVAPSYQRPKTTWCRLQSVQPLSQLCHRHGPLLRLKLKILNFFKGTLLPNFKTFAERQFLTVKISSAYYVRICMLGLIYRVSQEERSIFWEVIVSVILSKKLYMNMCPIPNGWMKSEVHRKKVDRRHELLVNP